MADKPVVAHRRQIGRRQRLSRRQRLRPLNRQLRVIRACQPHIGVEPVVTANPLEILVLVRRIHAKKIVIGGKPMDQQVVHESAVGIQQPRILRLAVLQSGRPIRTERIDQLDGLRPPNLDLAHVADIEKADPLAHREVLGDDARVFDGHIPSAEIDHPRARIPMNRIQRSLLERIESDGAGHANRFTGKTGSFQATTDPNGLSMNSGEWRVGGGEQDRRAAARAVVAGDAFVMVKILKCRCASQQDALRVSRR